MLNFFYFYLSNYSVFMNFPMKSQSRIARNLNAIILLLLFFPTSFFAQNPGKTFIEIPDEILATDISSDGKKILCSTNNYIYNLDVDNFEISDSVRLDIPENFKVKEARFLNMNHNLASIKIAETEPVYGHFEFRIPFFEYPQDSVFIYDLKSGQKIGRESCRERVWSCSLAR